MTPYRTASVRGGRLLSQRAVVASVLIACLVAVNFTLADPPLIADVAETSDTRVRIIHPTPPADTNSVGTVWISSNPTLPRSAEAQRAKPAPFVARLVISDVSSSPPLEPPKQNAARASFQQRFVNRISMVPKTVAGQSNAAAPSRPTMEVFSAQTPQALPPGSVVSKRLTAKPSLPDLAADLGANRSLLREPIQQPRQQPEVARYPVGLTGFDRVLNDRAAPISPQFAKTSSIFPEAKLSEPKPVVADYGRGFAPEAPRWNEPLVAQSTKGEVRLVALETVAPQEPPPPPASAEPEAPAESETPSPASPAPMRPIPAQPMPVQAVAPPVQAVAPAEQIAPTLRVRPALPQLSNQVARALPGQPTSQIGPFEVIDHTDELTVVSRRSKLLRTKVDVYRTAVVDPSVCDVNQFTPREISVIGKGLGATHVTFWFQDDTHRPITYLVRVVADPEVEERREEQYGLLEQHLAELFPNSKVRLLVVADKLIVKGQARDSAEAAQILAIIRGQFITGSVVSGQAASITVGQEDSRSLPAPQVINMLRIPGVHQVALRVKIAELNRSAARNFGVDASLSLHQGELVLSSLLSLASGTPSILGSFDGGDLEFGLHYLEEHGVLRMVSEPTLVCLSGKTATFVAGGEFAVPTTVGVGVGSAVTTDFRAFGAIITFRPHVMDKDHIRLEVAPEFSKIDDDNTVGGVPGLKTRAVTTTVEMREGQTLAIAGLLDDSMQGDLRSTLPFVARLLGERGVSRNETELIVLVTPELVHPMEPEEVPPLPGFDVTEPTNGQFYLHGDIEGTPTVEHRSTIWPRLQRRFNAGGPAMISGPYGHGD